MPLYEYKCTNTYCDQAGQNHERIAKADMRDEQKCRECYEELTRLIGITAGRHASWSQWNVI